MGGGLRASTSPVHKLFPVKVNVSEHEFDSNIRLACNRDLPWLQMCPAHEREVVIVGGGPSLNDTIEQVRWRKSIGHHIVCLNNTGHWLQGSGIKPDAQVLLDARPSNARFIVNEQIDSYIASQCAPETFEKAIEAGHNITLWHPNVAGIQDYIGDRLTALIGGGTTVGLQAMSIYYALGYRFFHLHGFDSSYRGDNHHAYEQPENVNEQTLRVDCGGKSFECARWMIHQADGFVCSSRQLADLGCVITVAGDGLIPTLAKEMMRG
jgi:hypothetical protein